MKKYYTLLIIIILSSYILYSFYNHSPKEITAEEARQNVKTHHYDYIVDVRTEQEWSEGHLPNTISIPIGTFVTELPKRIPNKNTSILFICKKGIRASAVALIAHKLGYRHIHYMIGNYKELV